MIWETPLTHETGDDLFAADFYLEDFFRRNKKKLDDSFVFLLSDHGLRWGYVRKLFQQFQLTRFHLGNKEASNPMLLMTLPKALRDPNEYPDLHSNIYANSNKLLTSFDIYATLKDLADVNACHSNTLSDVNESKTARLFPLPGTEES